MSESPEFSVKLRRQPERARLILAERYHPDFDRDLASARAQDATSWWGRTFGPAERRMMHRWWPEIMIDHFGIRARIDADFQLWLNDELETVDPPEDLPRSLRAAAREK